MKKAPLAADAEMLKRSECVGAGMRQMFLFTRRR